MVKTDNITRYTCDRCSESAYKQLAAKQDVEFQAFMVAKEQR